MTQECRGSTMAEHLRERTSWAKEEEVERQKTLSRCGLESWTSRPGGRKEMTAQRAFRIDRETRDPFGIDCGGSTVD